MREIVQDSMRTATNVDFVIGADMEEEETARRVLSDSAVAGPLPEIAGAISISACTPALLACDGSNPQREGRRDWLRCRHWIEAALPYCYGTHTVEDVERQIAEGKLQFWPGERCAVVTEIVDYPRLRALNFFLVGGDPTSPDGLRGAGLKELIEQMEPAIVEWARRLGCTRVAQTGRKGWSRILAPLGYQTTLNVMIRDLD